MPNIIHLGVDNPAELRNAGAYGSSAVIRIQSSSTEGGAYANISGTGSTPTITLADSTFAYTGYDPLGSASTWYRWRFENGGGTVLGDWATAYQLAGSDGMLVSLAHMKRRLNLTRVATQTDIVEDGLLLVFMSELTQTIQQYTGRRFVRLPLSGTDTFYFDVERCGRILRVPVGIASLSTLELAQESQPESAGTGFQTATAADVFLRPVEHMREPGWPATEIHISDLATGPVVQFEEGYNTARMVGALGWSAVPMDVYNMAADAVVRRFAGRGSGVLQTVSNDEATAVRILRWVSPEDMAKLDYYRVPRSR